MKRRPFIISAATVAIGLPAAYYFKKNKCINSNPFFIPYMLSSFCSEKTLREIGAAYRKQVPAENGKQKLMDLLLTDSKGKKIKFSYNPDIEDFISKQNQEEFLLSNTKIINGWIISITEARQCALFSLS